MKTYKDGLQEGKEWMANKAIRIWRRMRDKRSLAGNLWHSEDEIEDAITAAAEQKEVQPK